LVGVTGVAVLVGVGVLVGVTGVAVLVGVGVSVGVIGVDVSVGVAVLVGGGGGGTKKIATPRVAVAVPEVIEVRGVAVGRGRVTLEVADRIGVGAGLSALVIDRLVERRVSGALVGARSASATAPADSGKLRSSSPPWTSAAINARQIPRREAQANRRTASPRFPA
jgi:hypothetical protein